MTVNDFVIGEIFSTCGVSLIYDGTTSCHVSQTREFFSSLDWPSPAGNLQHREAVLRNVSVSGCEFGVEIPT